ncbi:uncharacterized protein A1O5_12965 [Cladophialophora psammophila CBS 110553]|uniref:Uncharacterized protein n=1 Tax=Cladophialophora psammophila CBS 110553 TaxID=1182543 RepID=W9W8M3_9EURO|nr:uncharacterized protein A1O5_12965 [Cladophialophora psammophila CBS 110553]EXJ54899.1 hypothetical protein A1O5_12965 [Cladophialophora psammophila CBS 110553]
MALAWTRPVALEAGGVPATIYHLDVRRRPRNHTQPHGTLAQATQCMSPFERHECIYRGSRRSPGRGIQPVGKKKAQRQRVLDANTAQQHFRDRLPDLSTPRFVTMAKQNAHEYAEDLKRSGQPPWIFALYQLWLELAKEPFKGVVRPDLHHLEDEAVPVDDIVAAATSLLAQLSDEDKQVVSYHVDALSRDVAKPDLG